MTYKGHIKNGVVVLDEPVNLPDGAEVDVEVRSTHTHPTTLSQRFADVIGSCPDLPPDMAENHDHYLHGREKK